MPLVAVVPVLIVVVMLVMVLVIGVRPGVAAPPPARFRVPRSVVLGAQRSHRRNGDQPRQPGKHPLSKEGTARNHGNLLRNVRYP
jgi:hypothetical protein